MKNLMKFFGFAAFLAFFGVACTSDEPCRNVECGDYGQCDGVVGVCQCDAGYTTDALNDGQCTMCADGYEGYPNCVPVRNKYLGTYSLSEDCGPQGTFSYSTEILSSQDGIDKIRIKNLGDYGCQDANGNAIDYFIEATVDSTSITINNFTDCEYTVNGSGTYTETAGTVEISIDYTLSFDDGSGGTTTSSCTATLIR